MEFYANIHARIDYCSDCGDVLPELDRSVQGRCRHCDTKKKHGVVDINTCFQGSVITLED
tara:strand:- start:154 stop:333 length:180 start_codon:yes stop_codon:yes gene_type:complete